MSRKNDPRSRLDTHARRQRVACEAARLMATKQLDDYAAAKRKAAASLGICDAASMPDTEQIIEQLRSYQRLFASAGQLLLTKQKRLAALRAMTFLTAFNPRLVGAVLDGTANEHSVIVLHVFCDSTEAITRHLADAGIPATLASRRIRLDRTHTLNAPVWLVLADEQPFEIIVLPEAALKQRPLNDGDSMPMPRASISTLRTQLAKSDDCQITLQD